jgi:eukaryotic-like serine/threonine-protein kinase
MSDSGIFKAAVKLSPESRAAYLDQACGSNHALRREVESLLQAHDEPGSFLQGRLAQQSATVDQAPSTETPGTVIGGPSNGLESASVSEPSVASTSIA